MLTVRVHNNYNLIALQGLDKDGIEGCEFSKKFRAETIGYMEKVISCVGHYIIQTTRKSSYFAFVRPYKGKVAGFSSSSNDFSVRHMPLVFPYIH